MGLFSVCSGETAKDIAGDIDGDFSVGILDLALFAEQWFEPVGCIGYENNCADIYDQDGVDLRDFNILASNWKRREIPLFINEVLALNTQTEPNNLGEYDDWIEIYNASDEAIDLGGMYLTDEVSTPTEWQFPVGHPGDTTVAAKGYLLVWADSASGGSLEGLHTSFGLDGGGEGVWLFDSDGLTLVDSVVFGGQFDDISFGREPDASANLLTLSPTPGSSNDDAFIGSVEDTEFNNDRGFYESSFSLAISCDTGGATIYYTVDGSAPDELSSEYTGEITIDKTTCLRAIATKAGWRSSNVDTHSYIFVGDVLLQSPNGEQPLADWPVGPVNGQSIDYGMDPNIVNDVTYGPVVDDALLSIPSLSIVTELENLFDPDTGIYVNALEYGHEWERASSFELINPDGSKGFQVNAGLRIRGGFSRLGGCPKHSLRLFFRNEYGYSKLEYKLFEDEGTDSFDIIDLRTAQNYSWSYYGGRENTFVRDVFARDRQRAMGQPYTRSRYYHLYLNGQYWGLYMTEERPEASYGASYFGGVKEDYDVVKADAGPLGTFQAVMNDGNFDAYEQLWGLANGFDDAVGGAKDAIYQQMLGNNPDGTTNPAYPKYVDVDNLIDYMLDIYYASEADGPISFFFGNKDLNNFYGVYNRNAPDGFKFFRHDGEHSLDRAVALGWSDRTGPFTVTDEKTSYLYFNPQTLHQWLMENRDYRMRFSDRVYRHFYNEGALTQANCVASVNDRADEIAVAIVAESARWGDAQVSIPRTKADWLWALDLVRGFFDGRVEVVIDQFLSKDWYPAVDVPVFYVEGIEQHGGEMTVSESLSMGVSSGEIYYTLDGSDPREDRTGAIAGTPYGVAISFDRNTTVKSRGWNGAYDPPWSALHEAVYSVGSVTGDLRVTEVMYHASEPDAPSSYGDSDFEFIEVQNTGDAYLNLNLVSFVDGIDFTFGDVLVGPGEFVVVVENAAAFLSRYTEFSGVIAGEYDGELDNSGERIAIEDSTGQMVMEFVYDDGWFGSTDGGGYSLNLSDVYSVEYAWRVSVFAGGSPGWDDRDDLRVRGDFTGEGVVDWDDLALMIGDWLEDDSRADIYPMPPGNDGVVNLADLAVLARHWLEGTAP